MRNVFILTLSVILLTSNAFAAVYQCKVNGKIVFSDKYCSQKPKKIYIRKSNTLETPESKKTKEDARNPNLVIFRKKKKAYLKRKEQLNDEIESINTGLNQSFNSLLINKQRKNELIRQSKRMDRNWQNYVDPNGAEKRDTDDKIDQLQKKVKRLKRKVNEPRSYTIQKNGKTTYCNESYGNVHCY